jgi:aminoglycoside 6'-N-acetyltransferase I
MTTVPLHSIDDADWLRLRMALWPAGTAETHRAEMASFLAQPDRFAQFIARDQDGAGVGFVEASIRHDYVNGTETSPVAFLEGLYVRPRARRQGVARALVAAVTEWARSKGCAELASDALIGNRISHATHRGLGFVETERVVYFNKRIG